MNCATFVRRNFEETSIHGLPYLMRRDLHWMERLFWLFVVVAATYFSIDLCLNQWERFRDNPIVLGMELTWDKGDFPYPGVTLCSDFRNEATEKQLIMDLWGWSINDTKFAYYQQFFKTLIVLRYDTLHTLLPYENDTTLQTIDFINILQKLQQPLESDVTFVYQSTNNLFVPAITEAGLCSTTSQLNEYTNPSGELQHRNVSDVQYCDFMSVCTSKVSPTISQSAELFVYLHYVHDVISPNTLGTIFEAVPAGLTLTLELEYTSMSAEGEVRKLPVAFRKCRYSDENNLRYFKIYNSNMCRMECRINKAMELCKCKPYFYAVAPELPICNVSQLLCLNFYNWTQTVCDCLPLCENRFYLALEKRKDLAGHGFVRTVYLHVNRPYMSYKRHVVFSTDQLVVSFGGAVSLFLGASFITCYSIIQIFGEFFISNCRKYSRGRWRIA